MASLISIIDNNTTLLTSLELQFQKSGYLTITFDCPLRALEYHKRNPADIYVIDMKMPKLNGVEFYNSLCQSINKNRIPALFLTGVDNLEAETLKNTTIGDYIIKPFNYDVLIARIEKILSYFNLPERSKEYKIGNLRLYEDNKSCSWYGHEIELTKSEFVILSQLVKRPRFVYSREMLLNICYTENYDVNDRNIDSHIKRLRKKFKKANPNIKFNHIKTYYGSGYSWSPNSKY